MGLLGSVLRSRTFGAAVTLLAIYVALERARPRQTVLQELDPVLGWRMLPSQHAYDRHLEKPEDINSFGFRDREWTLEARPGLVRVAMLGDSMTYGATVELEKTYPRILERRLRERGLDVEVMNFATQGYMLDQSAANYRVNVRRFRPDVVVMPFVDQGVKPMAPAAPPPRGDLRPALLRTAFYHWVLYKLRPLLPRDRLEEAAPPSVRAKRVKDAEEEAFRMALKPFDPEYRPWWKRAVETMESLHRDVQADGATLVLTVLPQRPYALDPKVVGPDGVWSDFASKHKGCVFVPVTPAVQEAMRPIREAIAAAASDADRQKAYETTGPPNLYQASDPGHFNEAGMETIAEALLPEIEKLARR